MGQPISNEVNPREKVRQKIIATEVGRQPSQIADYEIDDYLNPELIKKQIFGENNNSQKEFVLRVFLTNATTHYLAVNLAKIGAISGVSPYGATHAGIQINDKSINFYDNGLVKIDDLRAKSCFFLYSPGSNTSVPYTDEAALKIAHVITKWNGTIDYSQQQNNCQTFVGELVKTVIPDYQPTGLIADYIRQVVAGSGYTKTQAGVAYILKLPSLRGTDYGALSFVTHDELDNFQYQIQHLITPNERLFLKAFHRGFQVMELAYRVNRPCNHYHAITTGMPEEETLSEH